jgi:hypothetical protein
VTVVLETAVIIALSAYPDAAVVAAAMTAAVNSDVKSCFDFTAVHFLSVWY